MKKKKVVVTGIGPVSSMGIGKTTFWNNLLIGKPKISFEKVFLDDELWDQYYCHKVENFDIKKFGLDESVLDDIRAWKNGQDSEDLHYILAAMKLALDDSGLPYDIDKLNDLSLVVTHENMNLMPLSNILSEAAFDILKKHKSISKKDFFNKLFSAGFKTGYDTQSFMTLFHAARAFNIHKQSLFVCNACASGLYAIETASEMIQNDRATTVLVAASDNPDPYKHLWFKNLNIYSPDGIMRPFSQNCNGLVFGGGGIAIVVEELEHALKRKAPIYAEYLGGGFSLEGWKVTVPQIGSSSYRDAMIEAIKRSGVNKKDIELICPHGIGSTVIDSYESKAIADVFGPYHKNSLLTTFKPFVGHTLGASALMELSIMLLCLDNSTILPTLNSDKMNSRHKLNVNQKVVLKDISIALKTCTAFAGFNASAVFKKYK